MARKYQEQKAKPTNDAYTGMLAISFLALLAGCALLYMDYSQYSANPPAKIDPNMSKDRPPPDVPEGKPQDKDKDKGPGDDKDKEKEPGDKDKEKEKEKEKDKDVEKEKGV